MPVEAIDEHFTRQVRALPDPGPGLPGVAEARAGQLVELFRAQAQSRHLDFAARWLQAQGEGFYTIGSAGHEANAARRAAARVHDPALLHYRSGGFYAARAAAPRHPERDRPGPRGAAEPDRLGRPTRSRAGGTRSSATRRCTSSRRPRPSPPTCPARSASAFALGRAATGTADAVAGRRRRGVQLRRRLGQPLDRHGRPERRGLRGPPRAAAARCWSSARTTASGSAPGRRRGWPAAVLRRLPGLPATPSRRHATPTPARRRRPARSTTYGGDAARPCCTCGPSGSWATPGPTSSSPTARSARSMPTTHATRCWRRRRPRRARHPRRPADVLDRYEATRARSWTRPRRSSASRASPTRQR